jgi:hypothetical protein
MYVKFKNDGNTDILAPVLTLMSLGEAPLSYTLEGLSVGLTELSIALHEPGAPANLIRPGYNGSVKIYTKSTKPLTFKLDLP